MNQYKKGEDLEIYEIDFLNNKHLQEVCNVKQPILFKFKSTDPDFYENMNLESIRKYAEVDIQLKDTKDYTISTTVAADPVVLPFSSGYSLIKSDTTSRYFSEKNGEFIENADYASEYAHIDAHFRPTLTVQTTHDLLFGSVNATTPLQYGFSDRLFLTVTSGKIRVKMTPWKSSKYLHPITDYENYEFRSPVNPWNPHTKHANDMIKLKFLEFDVQEGYVLFIPPYWWYSIQYIEPDTFVASFRYNSAVNHFAHIKEIGLFYLQQSNITTRAITPMALDLMSKPTEQDVLLPAEESAATSEITEMLEMITKKE